MAADINVKQKPPHAEFLQFLTNKIHSNDKMKKMGWAKLSERGGGTFWEIKMKMWKARSPRIEVHGRLPSALTSEAPGWYEGGEGQGWLTTPQS